MSEASESSMEIGAVVERAPTGPVYWGTGRRKAAVARVRLYAGAGRVTINGKPLKEFFTVHRMAERAVAPLTFSNMLDNVDVAVNCHGGGITGQSDAMMLGVARALLKMNPEVTKEVRGEGYLTRDARRVERKKYGQPKARKRFQFSKR